MRAMGFTEEEINEAISRAGAGEVQGQSEQAQPGAAQANSRRSAQENPGAQSSILESYSEQDLAARDEAQRLKAEENARKDKAAEDKARADSERNSFTLTGSDRIADTAAARGQGDIFDQPAATPRDNQNPIKTETRASTGLAVEAASANQEKAKSPSDLEALFSGLDSSSVRKANKAKKLAAKMPQAARIDYVQANFHDILMQMMDAGALEVNGASTLTEDNKSCL